MQRTAIVVIGDVADSEFAIIRREMVLRGLKPQTFRPNFERIFGTVGGKIDDDLYFKADRYIAKKYDHYTNAGMSPNVVVDHYFNDKLSHLPPGRVLCVVYRSSYFFSGSSSELIDQLHRYWSGYMSDGSSSWRVGFFDLDAAQPFASLV
jgi:hypothetical protein